MSAKSLQLQIRITPEERKTLRRLAREAGQSVSSYVLSRALPEASTRFADLVGRLAGDEDARFLLAELNDLLAGLSPIEFATVVAHAPLGGVSSYHQNYVAAMVELAADRNQVPPPSWVGEVLPLDTPHFAVAMASLRPHLLRASPTAFKRRNIFIDATVGDRV